ncbi:MAG: Uma2 family endonuclease [Verrucomicrobiota bacterium]
MPHVLSTLPIIDDQHELNRRRWRELEQDSFLASLDHRIETDRFGKIVMMPPPGFQHSKRQSKALHVLHELMAGKVGQALTECPVSTSNGVKGIDVVWISNERADAAEADNILLQAPEICIEVSSPSNTRQELEEKKRLYFEANAEEVWIAGPDRTMAFFLHNAPGNEVTQSDLCPGFPPKL